MSGTFSYQVRGHILRNNVPVRLVTVIRAASTLEAARTLFQWMDKPKELMLDGVEIPPGCTVELDYRTVAKYHRPPASDINRHCRSQNMFIVGVTRRPENSDPFPETIVLGMGALEAKYQRIP